MNLQYKIIQFNGDLFNINEIQIDQIISKLKITKYIFGLDDNKKIALLTRGDITKNIKYLYTKPSEELWNYDFIYLSEVCNNKLINIFTEHPNINIIPIIAKGKIHKIVIKKTRLIDAKIACLISAGGKGERLGSLTKTIPKPLLYYKNKALIEHCIDAMIKNKLNDFYVSVCYKREMIKEFLGNGEKYDININYLEEDNPLGTLGAITMKDWSSYDYIVLANCDLYLNFDLNKALLKMKSESLDVLLLSNLINTYVPFGLIVKEGNESNITKIVEKPTLYHNVLSGIYIFKANLDFNNIPNNPPDYINHLIKSGCKVSNQIIYEDWLDLGQKECIELLSIVESN